MAGKAKRKARIGITPDNEMQEGNPARPFYMLDAQNLVALKAAGCAPVMLPHHIEDVDTYVDMLDGIIISGGGYQFPVSDLLPPRGVGDVPPEKRQRTEFELSLIDATLRRNKPLLAICGGVQTLNAAFGGKLIVNLAAANPAWAAHRSPPYDSVGHEVSVKFGTRLYALTGVGRFPVNSLHRQGIVNVGPGVVACAIADDGVVEAIEHPDYRFCLGVQWHPEFNISDADGRLLRGFVEECECTIDV